MNEILGSFMSNDSRFGRLMTRIGVMIGANLMFVIFSIPMITIGASYTALYHVCLRVQRGDGELNPFKEFWKGFRTNWKQATIVWIGGLLLFAFLYWDYRICLAAGGAIAVLRYPLMALMIALLIVVLYTFPVIAAFEDKLPNQLRNAVFFAVKKIYKVPVILFFNVFPLVLTYTDPQMMPLYGFIWVIFGYSAVVMIGAALLLPEMKPYLPLVDAYGDFILDKEGNRLAADAEEPREDTPESEIVMSSASSEPDPDSHEAQQKILDDMMRMGM